MGNDSEAVVANRTRCQQGRATLADNHRAQKCPNKTVPGSMYCLACRETALQRVRDYWERKARSA